LTMPYDGPLHIQLPEFRGSGKYPVSPQQPIAQMENSGSLLFYLDASTTSHFLSGNSSADLVLKHQIPGQEPTFSESAGDQILRINNQRQRFLTFAPTKPDDYFEKADSFQRVEILQNLDRTCHIVPKMSLLAYNQSNQTPDWQNLLQTLQPDFKVIAEGPGTLAIAPARN
jgi:hypothetical protein